MPATMALEEIDLNNDQLFEQHRAHEAWRTLRQLPGLHWNPASERVKGYWNLARYDDLLYCSRHPEVFSSERGITSFEPINEADALAASNGNGKMLITMDPPRHVKLRRLVNKGFTPRAVAVWEPHIRQITNELLDEFGSRGGGDFVVDVSSQLPLAVICSMMGLEREDWPLMFKLTNKVLGPGDPEYQEDVPVEQRGTDEAAQITGNMGTMQMFGFFAQLLQKRQLERKDDLVSLLMDSELEGDKLTDEDVLWFSFLLILAGNETTRNGISGGLLALFDHPGEKRRLLADMALLPSATEEILRWVSPVTHMSRVALQDSEINGHPIRQGERVVMWYPSANRDERFFPDAERFDITRTPNEHIAFGIGEHFCLGAGFARLEMRVMFEEFFTRFPKAEMTAPVERLRSNFIGGIKHLYVGV